MVRSHRAARNEEREEGDMPPWARSVRGLCPGPLGPGGFQAPRHGRQGPAYSVTGSFHVLPGTPS